MIIYHQTNVAAQRGQVVYYWPLQQLVRVPQSVSDEGVAAAIWTEQTVGSTTWTEQTVGASTWTEQTV